MIAAGIAVHRELGPGFLESIYERAMHVELRARGVEFTAQREVVVLYSGQVVGRHRVDLLVAGRLVVELKAVADISRAHREQLRSYVRATNCPTGLILNFGQPTLQIRRLG